MKLKTTLVFATLLVSLSAKAATWGPKELLASSEAVTEHVKESLGEPAYQGITAIAVELNAQKVAAKAKVTYTVQGTSKTASFFCHEHADTIDCH